MKVTYQPNSKVKTGFIKTLFLLFKNSIQYKELIYQLFKRDFLMQYKKSFLGMGWHIIAPVLGIVSWVFMNMAGVLQPGDVGIPYPLYVLLGTSLWGLFMGVFTGTSLTLSVASSFILQVNFPHEILIIKQIFQQLVIFFISFSLVVIIYLFSGYVPDWKIFLLPILVLPIVLFASAFGLFLSVLNVVSQDIQNVIKYSIGLLMYFTPIVYSGNIRGEIIQKIIYYNPLTYLIGSVRDVIITGSIAAATNYFIVVGLSALLFIFALRFFYVSEERVIEKII